MSPRSGFSKSALATNRVTALRAVQSGFVLISGPRVLVTREMSIGKYRQISAKYTLSFEASS